MYACTRIEFHFIADCNSHACALSRHSNKIVIDKQVCFYRRPIFDPVKSQRTITDPVRPLRGINRVVWGPILFHYASTQLMVWTGLLWPYVWLIVHIFGCLCLMVLLTHHWTPSPYPHLPTPFMWHLWHCRLCSKHLSKPASPTSSYICWCNDGYFSIVFLVQILCGCYQA